MADDNPLSLWREIIANAMEQGLGHPQLGRITCHEFPPAPGQIAPPCAVLYPGGAGSYVEGADAELESFCDYQVNYSLYLIAAKGADIGQPNAWDWFDWFASRIWDAALLCRADDRSGGLFPSVERIDSLRVLPYGDVPVLAASADLKLPMNAEFIEQ